MLVRRNKKIRNILKWSSKRKISSKSQKTEKSRYNLPQKSVIAAKDPKTTANRKDPANQSTQTKATKLNTKSNNKKMNPRTAKEVKWTPPNRVEYANYSS